MKVYRYSEILFNRHIVAFFETSPHFMHYLQKISTMLMAKYQNKADYASSFSSLLLLTFARFFLLF